MIQMIFDITRNNYDKSYIRSRCKNLCLSLKGEEYNIDNEKSNHIEDKYYEKFCNPYIFPPIAEFKRTNR